MVRLRVLELLDKSGHSKYWLGKQLDTSWQNLNRMLNNETKSIRYEAKVPKTWGTVSKWSPTPPADETRGTAFPLLIPSSRRRYTAAEPFRAKQTYKSHTI